MDKTIIQLAKNQTDDLEMVNHLQHKNPPEVYTSGGSADIGQKTFTVH